MGTSIGGGDRYFVAVSIIVAGKVCIHNKGGAVACQLIDAQTFVGWRPRTGHTAVGHIHNAAVGSSCITQGKAAADNAFQLQTAAAYSEPADAAPTGKLHNAAIDSGIQ